MKILLAHNFYRSSAPSGEDAVYRNERSLLEAHFEVVRFEKFNDDLDDSTAAKKIGLALSGAWSKATYDELGRLIRKTRPDVAHFHNTFPQITPSAWAACQENGVPVVQTLHNYRYICPGALLQREGEPCEDCLRGSLVNALRHRCYRDSLTATAAQGWMIARNRWNGSFRARVDRYIALTGFAAERLSMGGLPRERIVIKPNFLPDAPEAGTGEGGYAIYTGRLSQEKGVRTLLKAWSKISADIPLKLAGDGPLRNELEAYVKEKRIKAEFLGYCDRERIIELVGNAALQIVPSEWYEGFPMVILEAYACGTPVLASRIGSLDEVVEEGVTGHKFTPGNVDSLAETVDKLLANPEGLRALRPRVRQRFLSEYTAEANLRRITDLYRGLTMRASAA